VISNPISTRYNNGLIVKGGGLDVKRNIPKVINSIGNTNNNDKIIGANE
jgi:hypothetical protein